MQHIENEAKQIKRTRKIVSLNKFFLICLIGVMILFFLSLFHLKENSKITISKIGYVENKVLIKPGEYTFSSISIPESFIKNSAINYIENIRTVSHSFNQTIENWKNAQKFGNTSLNNKLKKYWTEWEINKFSKEKFQSFICITKIERQLNNQYEIHWNESLWKESYYLGEYYYYGYLNYKINFHDERQIFNKTLGLIFTDLIITQKEEI